MKRVMITTLRAALDEWGKEDKEGEIRLTISSHLPKKSRISEDAYLSICYCSALGLSQQFDWGHSVSVGRKLNKALPEGVSIEHDAYCQHMPGFWIRTNRKIPFVELALGIVRSLGQQRRVRKDRITVTNLTQETWVEVVDCESIHGKSWMSLAEYLTLGLYRKCKSPERWLKAKS
jgi:hypothetical protein